MDSILNEKLKSTKTVKFPKKRYKKSKTLDLLPSNHKTPSSLSSESNNMQTTTIENSYSKTPNQPVSSSSTPSLLPHSILKNFENEFLQKSFHNYLNLESNPKNSATLVDNLPQVQEVGGTRIRDLVEDILVPIDGDSVYSSGSSEGTIVDHDEEKLRSASVTTILNMKNKRSKNSWFRL